MRSLQLAAVLAGLLASTAIAQPLTTRFTYQGRLDSSGAPTSGPYDMRFSLFSAAIGGTQVGSTLCGDNLIVSADGTFTLGLDFGNVFDGNEKYLQIEVRADTGLACNNTTGFTTLINRQRLMATPHASYSLKPWSPTGTAGRITYTGAFAGINAATPLTTDTVFQVTRTGTPAGGLGGMFVTTDSASGRPFYGYSNPGGQSVYHSFDGSDRTWRLVMGTTPIIVAQEFNGLVGVGVTSPSAKLDVGGNALIGTSLQVGTDLNVGGNLVVRGQQIAGDPITRYLSLGAGAFVAAGNGFNFGMEPEGWIAIPNPSGQGTFLAPIQLPQGATLMDATLYFYDQSATQNISFALLRNSNDASSNVVVGTVTPAVSAAGLLTNAFDFADQSIDNASFRYTFRIRWTPDAAVLGVRAVRLRHSVTNPLP